MKERSLNRAIAIIAILCAALLIGMCILAYKLFFVEESISEPSPSADTGLTMREDTAPDRDKLYSIYDGTLYGPDDTKTALSAFRGDAVVIFFWSSWCPDCREYFENGFSAAAAAVEAEGAELLLVCREGVRGDTREAAQTELAALGIDREFWMDEDAALYGSMGFNSVPALAFLDKDGRLMYATSEMPDAATISAQLEYIQAPEVQTWNFISAQLTIDSGATVSGYSIKNGEVVQGDTVLSETMGMVMLRAAQDGDRELFDSAWSYVRDEMSVDGLAAWQIAGGEKAGVNSALDDLRIIDALITADENSIGDYRAEIISRAGALYDACVVDGYMRDFVEFDSGSASPDVTMCYQDAYAMQCAAKYDPRWDEPAKNALALLSDENALFSAENPLYYAKYNAADGTYAGEQVHMSEAMIALLNAARAGVLPRTTLSWLEATLQAGPVYAMYDSAGNVQAGYAYESTATYAIIAQTGIAADDEALARRALGMMEQKRCFAQPMTGGYGLAENSPHYTFDEIEALFAWHAVREFE